MTVRFSVVIPTHNRRRLAERAIASVLAQELPADEVIVVDDGSTDDTAEVLGRRTDIVFVSQPNGGAASARNTGWRAASHPWVAFLDSDDEWRPDHLQRTAAAIEATSAIGDVYFADLVHDDGRRHFEWADLAVDSAAVVVAADATAWAMAPRQPTMIQASVVRLDALRRSRGLAEWLWTREDTHLFVRLLAGRPAVAMGHIGTDMRDDAAGERIGHDSGRHDPERARRYWQCTVDMYRDLLDRQLVDGDDEKTLRRRLSGAHVRLSRQMMRRRPIAAVRHGVAALAADPAAVVSRVGSGA